MKLDFLNYWNNFHAFTVLTTLLYECFDIIKGDDWKDIQLEKVCCNNSQEFDVDDWLKGQVARKKTILDKYV